VGVETVDESFFADDNFETPESTPANMFLDDVFADDEDFKFTPQVVPKQQPLNRPSDVVPSSITMVRIIQNQPSA
jgi:hypothetical protein